MAVEVCNEYLSGAAARTGDFKKEGNKKYYKKEKQGILRKQQNHKRINRNSYKWHYSNPGKAYRKIFNNYLKYKSNTIRKEI